MNKTVNLLTSLIFVLILAVFSIAFVVLPDSTFSEQENRKLTTLPEFSFSSLADGTYSDEINDYFADQFPFRDTLVGIKGIAEYLSLKGENNGVLIGKNGQLAARLFDIYKSKLVRYEDMDYYSSDNVTSSLEAVNSFASSTDIELVTILPPRSIDTAQSAFSYPDEITESLHELINSTLTAETGYIDLLPLMQEKYDAGEYVYFRTDHHWTGHGAYYAYEEIMKAFGMEDEIISESDFEVETVADFYGTSWSKAGFKFVAPDTLQLYSTGNENDFTTSCYSVTMVKDENGKPAKQKTVYSQFTSWLDRSYLDTKDKYGALLGGTHDEQTVFMNGETDRERLLIVKDSFANSLVPFLAQHFDLVIINLADGVSDITSYAEEYGCDKALIVYNWENLITTNYLASVK